jgi:hypothetical protein
MTPRRTAITIVTAVAFLLAPLALRSAQADPTDEGRQHFTRGRQLYDAGDYRGAIAEFAAADQVAPSAMLEYNIALCHERLGEKAEAVRRYRAYLDRVPDATNRASVEEKVHKLEAEIEAQKPAPSGPVEPYPPEAPEGDAVPPPPPPVAGGPAPTGDPELDRVAGIDVGRVHAERNGGQPPGPAMGMSAQGSASAGGPPPAGPPPEQPAPQEKSKPIYKQWWFWVVAGVSAIILIDIATSDSDGSNGGNLLFPAPGAGDRGSAPSSGPVLLRF